MSNIEILIENYKRIFGLDKDLFTQYVNFLLQTIQGNFGISIFYFPRPVIEIIYTSIPWTIGLLTISTLISWTLGTLLGTIAGWKEGGKSVQILTLSALLLYLIPYYISAIFLMLLFALLIPILPGGGAYSIGIQPGISLDFIIDVIKHAILPASSIVLSSVGGWFLGMRAMMSTVKGEDYILMAEAKGLKKSKIMWSYAFRNAILPQVTGLSLSLGGIVGGAMITEALFSYPGIGWVIYSSIVNLDYPVIQGCVTLLIISVCTINLLVDLLYPILDPRIKYGGT
ncbi:MAG: ABC transporter permease [Candidatus Brockarchaeota archaeon]|nr:ABC transporter permease [Candidatus Brockarchaeota archaeon]